MNADNPYQPPKAVIEIPQIPGDQLPLATRGSRLGGAMIDGLIMLPIILGAAYALGWFSDTRVSEPSLVEELGLGIGSLGVWIAINYHLLATNGQTIGKKAVGTKIVRSNGDPVTAGHVILKRLLPITALAYIPIVGNIVSIVDSLCIFRKSVKCLHDDIADTIVVQVNASTARRA